MAWLEMLHISAMQTNRLLELTQLKEEMHCVNKPTLKILNEVLNFEQSQAIAGSPAADLYAKLR